MQVKVEASAPVSNLARVLGTSSRRVAVAMRLLNIIIAWAAMAAFVTATPVSLEVTPERNYTPILPKTVFSSKLRLVYVVGIEGTGHHYVNQVNKRMFHRNGRLVQVPPKAFSAKFYQLPYSMGQDVPRYSEALVSARDDMRKLAQRGSEMDHPGTMLLFPGRFSYPFGFGPNKGLRYVDLRILAEVAEEEGVDFRVLYMQRSVTDLLLSVTVHRTFQNGLHNEEKSTPQEKYMQYMQVLLTDIAVVHSFLGELDPGFVVCFDYNRIGDANQSASVANFVAPTADVAKALDNSFVALAEPHAKTTESLLYEGGDVIASRFQRKLDAFESQLCSGTRQE